MAKANRQLEEIFAELGQKMDQLLDSAKENKDKVTDDIEENMKWVKEKWRELRDEQEDRPIKDRWKEAEPHLKSAFKEFGEAFRAFGTKKD